MARVASLACRSNFCLPQPFRSCSRWHQQSSSRSTSFSCSIASGEGPSPQPEKTPVISCRPPRQRNTATAMTAIATHPYHDIPITTLDDGLGCVWRRVVERGVLALLLKLLEAMLRRNDEDLIGNPGGKRQDDDEEGDAADGWPGHDTPLGVTIAASLLSQVATSGFRNLTIIKNN